jgi:hypothetical protein
MGGHSQSRKGGRKGAKDGADDGEKQPRKPPAKQARKMAQAKARAEKEAEEARVEQLEANRATADETIERVGELRQTVVNTRGRRRGYYENCLFLTMYCSFLNTAMADAQKSDTFTMEDMPDPQLLASNLGRGAGMNTDTAKALCKNFLADGTVLVNEAEHHGFGCPASIESARRLNTEQLKFIDELIEAEHASGFCISIPEIRKKLKKQFPQVDISVSAVRYAVVTYCNDGSGYYWGKVKPRKCESDPDRIDVKRTYLKDYADAWAKEMSGTHVIVYLDESYLHQYHAANYSWIKVGVADGNHINRGAGGGKRLIMLHAITKNGPLVTRYPAGSKDAAGNLNEGQPIVDFTWGAGRSKDITQTASGGLTCETLWTASQRTGDYHDNMDSERFMDWVEHRLLPTFKANYPDKKMIVVSEYIYILVISHLTSHSLPRLDYG